MRTIFPERRPSRLFPAALLFALALAPLGCGSKEDSGQPAVEGPAQMASTVRMGDPSVATQLASGFYGVEQNQWRWTKRQFGLVLKTPDAASRNGATLVARLTVPGVVIEKLGTVTLSATANGGKLAPETYSKPGAYVYTRDIPPAAFGGDSVKVDFELDRVMPPTPPDLRELGVVMTSIGVEPK